MSHVFQSTLPRRERRPANGRFRCAPPHFNPRSREGSDIFRLPQSIRSDISIHAPAKGATRELRDADEWEVLFQSTLPRRERLERKLHNKQTDIISIHAPAKGATSRPTSISSTAAFQSTLPRRERPPTQATPTARHDTFQSTLPRRERPTIKRSAKLNQSFQSTLPRRERHVVRAVSVKYDSVFQSTLPRRERRVCACGVRVLAFYFNPRSREGSDGLQTVAFAVRRRISIHAPAKGATYFDYLKVSVRIFQSTLPRRERRASYETRTSGRCYFNPRSREGSDSSANSIINRQTLFQSTLPRRERHPAPLPSHPLQHFNPRSREGSDRIAEPGTYDVASISIHAPAKGATASVAHTHRRRDDFNPRSREGSDHTTVLDS